VAPAAFALNCARPTFSDEKLARARSSEFSTIVIRASCGIAARTRSLSQPENNHQPRHYREHRPAMCSMKVWRRSLSSGFENPSGAITRRPDDSVETFGHRLLLRALEVAGNERRA